MSSVYSSDDNHDARGGKGKPRHEPYSGMRALSACLFLSLLLCSAVKDSLIGTPERAFTYFGFDSVQTNALWVLYIDVVLEAEGSTAFALRSESTSGRCL